MNNRTAAALVAVALLAVAGATATGAFTTTTGVHENLEATPGTGPNGEYATVSDGQLAFAFGEVNREGITRFAGVFSLTYTGNASAEVWVDDGSSAVTFTALADSIEGEDDAVTLQPGDSLSVGVEVDTTETDRLSADGVSLNAKLAGDTGGAESVSVSQSEPGVVEVSATNVSADDPVTVDTTGSSTSENATVDSLSVTTTQSTDLSMSVSMGTENGSAPAFEFGGDAAENTSDDTADDSETNDSGAIGYINVTHEAAEETIGGAAFTFTVEKATLDERGLNHSQVQLYRYHGGSWNGVSTSMVGEPTAATPAVGSSPTATTRRTRRRRTGLPPTRRRRPRHRTGPPPRRRPPRPAERRPRPKRARRRPRRRRRRPIRASRPSSPSRSRVASRWAGSVR